MEHDSRKWTFSDWCGIMQRAIPAALLVLIAMFLPFILVAILILWK